MYTHWVTLDKKIIEAHDDDKDKTEVDRDIQKQLLLDQDWSDDEGDEDDEDDNILSPENEIAKEIETLKDTSELEHFDGDKGLTELINRIDADLQSC